MLQANGKLSDLYVSFVEANALLDQSGSPATDSISQRFGWPSLAETEREIEAIEVRMAARGPAECVNPTARPVEHLKHCFRLDETQLRLLLAAAAPLISVDLSRLYAFAWADFTLKQPSVGFLAELVADGTHNAESLVHEFRDHSPLVRYRLVALRDVQAHGTPTPLLHRAVTVPDRVVSFLQGVLEPIAARLVDTCELHSPADVLPVDDLVIRETTARNLDLSLKSALESPEGRPRLLLIGAPGSGRRTALRTALSSYGWGLMTVRLKSLLQEGERLEESLVEIGREALLRRCMLFIRGDSVFSDREIVNTLARPVSRALNPFEGPIAVAVTKPTPLVHWVVDGLFDVPFKFPTSAQQRTLWSKAIDRAGCRMNDDVPAILTQRFNVTPGTIHHAVNEAQTRAALLSNNTRVRLQVEDLTVAIRRRTDHALGAIAEPFGTNLNWDDVILPERILKVLREILTHAKHRETVYDDWGFKLKAPYGHGLSCLFSGVPGTGKTMMAAILAKTLGRECYRVDLSRVVSKWVGETQKNLAVAFDEAERGQVVLLFDEADSLFSKRTKQQSSNDRHANMEINYLLQRMDDYDGTTILTTNNDKGIDEAFKRRLKFKVNFPLPDAELRARLWQTMLPSQARVEDDIEFEYLGREFEMSGGNIRNAVLRAAFYAAEGDGIITHDLLYQAALAEAREMGMVVREEHD
jgi:ATP-dependent 26S proteasome regulatory subunit